jgi:hypothetical protein
MKRFTLGIFLLMVCLGVSVNLSAQVHTIESDNPFSISDPQLGVSWLVSRGYSTISWHEATTQAFFYGY